jgi:hypothetical protein
MQSINKMWRSHNNTSRATRSLVLLLSLAALMMPVTSIGYVRAQDQSQTRKEKLGRPQGQNTTKEAQSDKATSFPDAQDVQGADSQKDGDGGVTPSVPWPQGGGDASFSNGVYNCANTSYTYSVRFGPPNVCGELRIRRNNVPETGPNWICTDANGNATKGPWTVTKDQTGTDIHIRWPDGTRTSGGETKIDDYSKPEAFIDGGYPGSFSGYATDAPWGSGFSSWTTVRVRFLNETTGLYWNGSGYGSFSPVNFVASMSGGGTYITWSKSPPPPSHHVPGNTYKWCVEANDRCSYSVPKCVTFVY